MNFDGMATFDSTLCRPQFSKKCTVSNFRGTWASIANSNVHPLPKIKCSRTAPMAQSEALTARLSLASRYGCVWNVVSANGQLIFKNANPMVFVGTTLQG